MQALVLAGGEGTRLRPLTLTLPKPVIPLAGRPFLSFMLDWLRRHGVDDVLLSCGYRSDDVERVLGHEHRGMRLRYVVEDEPLGTAGPLRLAADEGVLEDRILVLNGDTLTDLDLTAEIAQHEATGAKATLALVAVEDTASYGVVPTSESGEVEAFLEKQPGPAPTNRINAGAYVLERSVLDVLEPNRPASIERDVFPRLVGEGLYGYLAEGYWLDIGTPERYLTGSFDILEGTVDTPVRERMGEGFLAVDDGVECAGRIIPAAMVERGCRIGENARVGGRVVLEADVTIGDGTSIEGAVILRGAEVGANCTLRGCIVGPGARIGDGCVVEGLSVLGEGVTVGAGNVIANGARLFPGLELPDRSISF